MRSIQDLKNAYKQDQLNRKEKDSASKFAVVLEGPLKKDNKSSTPHQSIFRQKINQDFLKSSRESAGDRKKDDRDTSKEPMNVHDDFEITIACSKKPDNFDEMQELQNLAAENYKQELEDLENRYEGLTPFQKKQCILQELEDAQNPRKSSARGSARPKWSRVESSAKKP